MSEAELTLEERKHLYNMVAMAFFITLVAFLAYFVYLMRTDPLQTGWDFSIRMGIPYSIIGPTSWFLAYEVFYPKRVRKSPTFHAKRFARRALSLSVVVLSFSGVISLSEVTFYKTLGDFAIWPGLVLFVFVFSATVLLWLRHHNSRIQQSTDRHVTQRDRREDIA
jgi:hypothetical protein